MNYDEARVLGPDSDAPGAWNWTTRNDGVIRTAPPCAWPDFDWSSVPFSDILAATVTPAGRARCDHASREEAELHHWTHELDSIRIEPIDLATVRERRRCDVPGCSEWQTHQGRAAWLAPDLCDAHANRAGLELVYPFVPGLQEVHS